MIISPEEYRTAAVVAREVGAELLSRLDLMAIEPRLIIDAGCALGDDTQALAKRYPHAQLIALDYAQPFLQAANLSAAHAIAADCAALPLKNQVVDIFYANLYLPFAANWRKTLTEWRRVMRSEGLFLFSALGVDSFKEYQTHCPHTLPTLIDMHDLGDLLLHCGFSDPVVDVSYLTVSYSNQAKFMHEMYASGMWQEEIDSNCLPKTGPWQANFEVIYGHAFAPEPASEVRDNVTYFPLEKLRRRR
jgi:malonyl-CoA O-methyltransferase